MVMKKSVALIIVWLCLGLGVTGQTNPLLKDERKSRDAHSLDEATKDKAADHVRMNRAEYRRIAERDHALKVDGKNKSLYVCAAPARSLTGPDNSNYTGAATFPYEQTFKLHTRPGATRVIYLDFDGHTTSGTDWNDSETRGRDFTTPPLDIDGDTTAFSNSEKAMIQNVWRRVSEDYAAFDVDVTTEDPGVEAIRQSGNSDTTWGIRVVIGGDSSQWFSGDAGGVAYVGSFGSSIDTPVYIFSEDLSDDEKWIAEAVSHEVGHSVGLNHMGQSGRGWVEYYEGHADWAPIMGVGYDREVVQWSKGEYLSANNTEDEIAIISSYVPRLVGDHGTDSASATIVSAEPSFSIGGVIVDKTDKAWYKITTNAGTLNFAGVVASLSPNLKLSISLANSEGTIFATSPITTEMNATLSTGVPAGTYYIIVDGIGTGNAKTAYNDYGSLGRYTLNATFVASVFSNIPPVASAVGTSVTAGSAPFSVNFIGSGSNDPDGIITSYLWDFGDGSTSTEANPVHVYALVGNYNAVLKVTDNYGYIGSTSVPITVSVKINKNTPALSVSSLKLSWAKSGKTNVKPQAIAIVVDQRSRVFEAAKVTYRVVTTPSGGVPVTTTSSVIADRKGVTTLLGTVVPTTFTGTVQFTILSVEAKGYVYNSAANKFTISTLSR
jgi:PKD repeat protein